MSTLPDLPTGLRLFRAASGMLAVAVILGVWEVLIRYGTAETTFVASQLTLASATNVAVLGGAGLFAIASGLFLGWLIGIFLPARRLLLQTVLIAMIAGGLAGLLCYGTRGFGLTDLIPHHLGNVGAAIAFGLLGGYAVWRLGLSKQPSLMNLTRACVLLAWVLCGVACGLGAEKTNRYVNDWLTRGSTPADEPAASAVELPNFMIIVLDTLRADSVGAYGESKLTPNLDRFAQSSALFEHAISTAPWTLPAHASLLTGLYPDEHGVNWGHYELGKEPAVIPELLKDKGYASFAISNNHLLNEANGFARGFDTFLETAGDPSISAWKLALRCGAAGWLSTWIGLSSDAGFDQGSAWTNWLLKRKLAAVVKSGRPFFSLLNYFEPHDPYLPPRRFVERLLSATERTAARRLRQGEEPLAAHACGQAGVYTAQQIALLNKLYDGDVAYQDERFGELLNTLERTGLLDNTWIIVTSDHGELFGESGLVYHTASAHYQLLHVPMLVRPPGGMGPERIAAPVQPVDIFATVLAKAAVPIPQGVTRAYELPLNAETPGQRTLCIAQTHGASIAGLSITQRLEPQSDLSRWMRWIDVVYRDGFALETDSEGGLALYQVAQDPAMAYNLAESRTDIVESMLTDLHGWSGKDRPAIVTAARDQVAGEQEPSPFQAQPNPQERDYEKAWLPQAFGW